MTEDGRLRTEDKRQSAGETAVIGRPSSAFRRLYLVAVFTLLPLLFVAGCKNRALEQAQQESRDARVTVEKLKATVNAAAREIATVKEELNLVRQNRDELQKQVEQLTHERDQASTSAQQAQEAISRLTTQESGQRSATAALERQIAELKTLVEDQHKLIEQLQKGAAPATGEPAQPSSPPTEPNQIP
jgi:archaellum component FlaC